MLLFLMSPKKYAYFHMKKSIWSTLPTPPAQFNSVNSRKFFVFFSNDHLNLQIYLEFYSQNQNIPTNTQFYGYYLNASYILFWTLCAAVTVLYYIFLFLVCNIFIFFLFFWIPETRIKARYTYTIITVMLCLTENGKKRTFESIISNNKICFHFSLWNFSV